MPNGETTINEVMEFLQDNMAMKQDVANLEHKMNDRFVRLEQKIEDVHLSLSGQIRMIEIELKDIKESLANLEKRTFEDTGAIAGDFVKLQNRVKVLENQIRQLQSA